MKKPHLLSLEDFNSLAQARDELLLQAHLFKAEAGDRWQQAEQSWATLREELRVARESIDRSSLEVAYATQLLYESCERF
jgi:hypothetical protein